MLLRVARMIQLDAVDARPYQVAHCGDAVVDRRVRHDDDAARFPQIAHGVERVHLIDRHIAAAGSPVEELLVERAVHLGGITRLHEGETDVLLAHIAGIAHALPDHFLGIFVNSSFFTKPLIIISIAYADLKFFKS